MVIYWNLFPGLQACAATYFLSSKCMQPLFHVLQGCQVQGTLSSAPDLQWFLLSSLQWVLYSTAGPGGQRRGIGALRVKARDWSPPTQPSPEPRPFQDTDGQQGMLPQRNPPSQGPYLPTKSPPPSQPGKFMFYRQFPSPKLSPILFSVQESMQSYQVSVLFPKAFLPHPHPQSFPNFLRPITCEKNHFISQGNFPDPV